ncbi:hypothetical protein [Fischerella thermalis]|nr:hypothetical protein [Fischerella thermalis]
MVSCLLLILLTPPHCPITPSPHHPTTPSPHHPISPSPHHPNPYLGRIL